MRERLWERLRERIGGFSMSGARHKLNRAFVKSVSSPGRFGDGGGLYLLVAKSGAKSWVYRYSIFDKRRDMGLGPLTKINHIDKARESAQDARALVAQGIDPIEQRRCLAETKREEIEAELIFEKVIEMFFELQRLKRVISRTEQTRRRWHFCLNTHARKLFIIMSISRDIKTVGMFIKFWSPDLGFKNRNG